MFNPVSGARAKGAQILVSLQYPDYRRLWIASLAAGAAHWALIVARGWLVFDLTDSSVLVGVVTFAAMIPRFVVSPFAGLLADRMDRRVLLAWTYGINLANGLLLAALTLGGLIEVWHLVVLSLVNGAGRASQMPAAGALVPNLVPRTNLLNAIALNAATVHGTRLLGPLSIAPLLATTGPSGAFLLCAALYAVGLFHVLRIRTVSTGVVQAERGIVNNLLAGLHYVYHHPVLLPLIILAVAHCALTMSFESLLPVLSRDKFNASGAGFGYIMMAVGGGAMVGVMGLAGIGSERVRGRLLLLAGLGSGLAPIGLALSPNLYVALGAAAVMGLTQGSFMTLFASIVQAIVPDAIRGRVTSINNLHIGGMMAAFNLVNGSLADLVGAPLILALTGGAFAIVVPLSLLSLNVRRVYGLTAGNAPLQTA